MEWKASQASKKGSAQAPSSKKPPKVDAPSQPKATPTTSGEKRKQDNLSMLKVVREVLEKQNMLGGWERLTDKSLTFTMKQLDNKYGSKMPSEFRKAFLTLSVCLPSME